MFSCEISQISENSYFYRTPQVATSDTTNATHAVQQTREINVDPQRKWFHSSGTPSQIFPLSTYSGWWFPKLSQQTKNIFKVGDVVRN